jgi:hypothetical protein
MISRELVKQAIEKFEIRYENYKFFFDNLQSPDWIVPLKEEGYFQDPPEPIIEEELRGFPFWPESRYLSRMAPFAHGLVLDIALDIPETENIRVHEDIVNIALAIPAHLAVRVVPKVKEWLKNPYHLLLQRDAGKLVEKLAKEGEGDTALDLASSLLEIIPDPRREELEEEEQEKSSAFRLSLQSRARIEEWKYDEILKNRIPALVEAKGIQTIQLLCDLLETALRLEERNGEGQDNSYIWRPAIEDHFQNKDFGIKSKLVTAIRNASQTIIEPKPEQATSILDELESRPYRIFQRLALYLLRLFPNLDIARVSKHLGDRKLFDDPHVHHEYFHLIEEQFENLTEIVKQDIFSWIEEGIDIEQYKENMESVRGIRPSDEEVEKANRYWKLEQLTPIRHVLDEKWQTEYEELLAELGDPPHPEFLTYITSHWGPTSPKTVDELKQLSVQELISYLKEWKPPKEEFDDSPEGLGRYLTSVVSNDPGCFAVEALQFRGLDPTYVRGVISGFREACGHGKLFSWEIVIDLCQWVVDQGRQIEGRSVIVGDSDPDWGWTRKAIAGLLEKGFLKGNAEIPFSLRQKVWSVLEPITNDPDPDQEYERNYGPPNMSYSELSINSVRGGAMHSVIHYGLWCGRHIDAGPEESKEKISFEEMPEVKAVLDKHLDPEQDPSLAIRSVYGQWLLHLADIDFEWVENNVSRIFSKSSEQLLFRNSAWETYLTFCSVDNHVADLLMDEYKYAVAQIRTSEEGEQQPVPDPEESLAEHLMVLYWRGKLPLDESDGVLSQFWNKPSVALRAYAIEFVGRSLRNAEGSVEEEFLDRLRILWAFRLKQSLSAEDPDDYMKEIAAFGSWFGSRKLDDVWCIEQLDKVLDFTQGRIEPDFLVVERLTEISRRFPLDAVKFLRRIVLADREGWIILGSRDAVQALLQNVLDSDNQEARTKAIDLINELGAMGIHDFGDLLPK